MRIRKPGKICDHLWFLGTEESSIYLVEGKKESIIISGGLCYIVPFVIRQVDDFSIDRDRIKSLLILHSHFDHVGVVPFFKRTLRELSVYASARAWELLETPKAIDTINSFSFSVIERMNMEEACSGYDLKWRDDVNGIIAKDGDIIRLGDLDVHIFETPGHSSCSITAYVPQIKALFPSDGGGIPYQDDILPAGNSNYTSYQKSLDRLKELETEYLCADHYGYIAGNEAKNYIHNSIESANEFRTEIEEVYGRLNDVGMTAKEITNSFYRKYPDYFLSPEILAGVNHQMVRHIAGEMNSVG